MFNNNIFKRRNIFPLKSLFISKTNKHSSSSTNLGSSYGKENNKILISKLNLSKALSISSSDDLIFNKMKYYLKYKHELRMRRNKFKQNQNLYLTDLKNAQLKSNNSITNMIDLRTGRKYSKISLDSVDKNNFLERKSFTIDHENSKKLLMNKYDNDEFKEIVEKIKKNKINFQIFCLIDKDKNKDGLAQTCLGINKFNEITNLRNKSLNNLIKNQKEKINDLENNIELKKRNNNQIIEINKREIYYITFLKKHLEKQIKKLNQLREYKRKVKYDIKFLKKRIEKINRRLIRLKDMRNFLIKVKERKIQLPPFFFLLESGKSKFENIDKGLIMKYKEYLNVNNPIFEDINEIEQIFNELRINALNDLNRNNKIKSEIEDLKRELKEFKENIDYEKEKYINLLHEKRKIVFQNNQYLQKIYDELIMKNNLNNIKLIENIEQKTLMKMNYNNLIKNNSMIYSLLYEKLIKGILFFMDKKIIDQEIFNNYEINSILNKNILYMNQGMIYNFVLKCLKIYEKIAINILNKHINFLNSTLIKNEIHHFIKQKKNINNIKNVQEKKIILEDKINYKINKMKEKLNKKYINKLSQTKAKYLSISPRILVKQKSSDNIINNENITFFDLIEY